MERIGGILTVAVLIGAMWGMADSGNRARAGDDHVLIVAGTPGSRVYERRFGDWQLRFRALFGDAGVPPERIVCLNAVPAAVPGARPADAGALAAEFGRLASTLKPDDRFILVLLGHGVITEDPPTFVLAGGQPDAEQFKAWLGALPAMRQAVLNFSGSSGAFTAYLSKPGRIILSALSADEGNEPILAEFFLRGVESFRADLDRDGRVTLLEAFNWAAWETGQWNGRLRQMGEMAVIAGKDIFLPRGDWKIDGRESVEIFHRLYDGPADDPGTRRLAPESVVDLPDPPVPLRPAEGRLTRAWRTRRILPEHAVLEDVGEPPGATPFLPWIPLAADPGDADSEIISDPEQATRETFGFHPVDGREAGTYGALSRGMVLRMR